MVETVPTFAPVDSALDLVTLEEGVLARWRDASGAGASARER